MDIGRLRLALQGAQAAAGLALDVEGSVEIALRSLQLQLSAPAALSMLAEARRLLHQKATVAWLRVDDLVDSALRDHRVHLPSQVRVRERLDHVDQLGIAPRSAGQLAIAVSIQAPGDRNLRKTGIQCPSLVSSPASQYLRRSTERPRPRRGGGSLAVATGEDHVLHRLPADRERALLSECPEDRVRMFYFPQPFGPTITLTPGEKTSRVRSEKDLKPLIDIELRCMESLCGPVGSLSSRTAFADVGFVGPSRCPTGGAVRGPRPRPPAQRPSCFGPARCRSPRRRPSPRPRSGARVADPPRG